MSMKLCPGCQKLAHYSSHFEAWICEKCGHKFDQVERNPIKQLQNQIDELRNRIDQLEKVKP